MTREAKTARSFDVKAFMAHYIPKSLGGYGKTGFIHDAIRLSGIDVNKNSRNNDLLLNGIIFNIFEGLEHSLVIVKFKAYVRVGSICPFFTYAFLLVMECLISCI
ncbi:hypothetical protein [Aneurinibacillus aneurinilyticus]|uniref:Uncharacterized protein n=1 Tax=Aneurinibacillus aneurinilyticus ATCC 12856 TaxID=649747 RepID=U1X8V2_ANEAE|nr:hypothetical protein [Aneurinibacillus aneurinilyticus]ERI11395.1 hypothetical protein HMPREF0083_00539 [Aneurinibacillus aneurinilyticus ATCC 12856]MED0673944.1 hypothetical protein [Aneurinibacillus aneurinilyticus]MED0708808.1 hypothetical protein [Aneurinibacillus aneurinilyticus]MED0722868.1 hypothetical protein [Aneurinibacillus aneurinilyticus]MED0742875.1 hypothetical protein [Aneurinibacillus aneurinilyticus]